MKIYKYPAEYGGNFCPGVGSTGLISMCCEPPLCLLLVSSYLRLVALCPFVLLQSRITGSCRILWLVKASPFRDNCMENGWETPRESLIFVQHAHPQVESKDSAFCSHSGRSLWFSQSIDIVFLYSVHRLVFLMNAYCSLRGANLIFIYNVDSFASSYLSFDALQSRGTDSIGKRIMTSTDSREVAATYLTGVCCVCSKRQPAGAVVYRHSMHLGYINYNCIVISFLRFTRTSLATNRYLAVCIKSSASGICFTTIFRRWLFPDVNVGWKYLPPTLWFELDFHSVVLQLTCCLLSLFSFCFDLLHSFYVLYA